MIFGKIYGQAGHSATEIPPERGWNEVEIPIYRGAKKNLAITKARKGKNTKNVV